MQMSDEEIEQARRWVKLKGWDWLPGMVAWEQRPDGGWEALRILHIERLGAPDVATMEDLAKLINEGALGWLPGVDETVKVTPAGKPGDACGFVGIELPIERDEYGDLNPVTVQTSGSMHRFIPDIVDYATCACLNLLAMQMAPGAWLRPTTGKDDFMLALLEACERVERARVERPLFDHDD